MPGVKYVSPSSLLRMMSCEGSVGKHAHSPSLGKWWSRVWNVWDKARQHETLFQTKESQRQGIDKNESNYDGKLTGKITIVESFPRVHPTSHSEYESLWKGECLDIHLYCCAFIKCFIFLKNLCLNLLSYILELLCMLKTIFRLSPLILYQWWL